MRHLTPRSGPRLPIPPTSNQWTPIWRGGGGGGAGRARRRRAACAARRRPAVTDPPDLESVDTDMAGVVRRAQDGDPDAFRLLYRDIQPRLLRYLHTLAGQDAEDIAAETWLHITRDLPAFTGSYDAFRGWTATIARHRALDHIRGRSRRPPALPVPAHDLAGLPGTDDTAQGALDNLATSTALTLINTLPPDQAEAVLLRA